MTDSVTEFLLARFPDRSTLSHEDFIAECENGGGENPVGCYAYDYDFELEQRAFEIISKPWPEIDWLQIRLGGGSVPRFLNKKSYLHAFPSLLNYLYILPERPDDGGDLLAADFILCLDFDYMSYIEKEVYGSKPVHQWRREFYFSLDDEVKQMICRILFLSEEKEQMLYAEQALASYWIQFSDCENED